MKLTTEQKNNVLSSMMRILEERRTEIIEENKKDIQDFGNGDPALLERLIVNDKKVNEMILAVEQVKNQTDPVGRILDERILDNGLKIENRTAPFGTILIIYESRPDVTIEAAVLAFKANSRILLKGGKEAIHSNKILVECWHQALKENSLDNNWIELFTLNRTETQEFLKNPTQQLDLIVPRGGEKLIQFVKEHATCPVLVSGRGNNFAYIAPDANWEAAKKVIINAKTNKISGCNALDKVLVDQNIDQLEQKLLDLENEFKEKEVELIAEEQVVNTMKSATKIPNQETWYEEFLARKACVGLVNGMEEAIQKINEYSGGHSSVILTQSNQLASQFMEEVDSAAVYHNASTRFTDGGQMGVGAELAISTDKLHHRGPLGLDQLVTNKYFVFGDHHIRN